MTRNSTRQYKDLKTVNVKKMVLIYAPKIVVSWIDIRLKFCSDKAGAIEKSFLFPKPYLWTPKITLENRAKRETSFNDPGKIGKCSIS